MLRSSVHVAVVDEAASPGEPILDELQNGNVRGIEPVERHAVSSALRTLPGSPADCVIIDPAVAGGGGLELLTSLRRAGVDAAFVCLASSPSVALAADCMRAGADDYVAVDTVDADQVARVVRQAVERAALRREAAEYARDLEVRNGELLARKRRIMGFYHTIAGELRAPLLSVGHLLERLRGGGAGSWNDDQVRLLDDSLHGHRILSRIADDLLLLSRIDRGEVVPVIGEVPLAPLLDRVVRTFEGTAARGGIDLSAASTTVTVRGDEELLFAVLGRLVHNALKYTPEGGTVAVEARPRTSEPVTITVRDTGRGIAPEDQGRIFDRLRKGGDLDPTLQPGLGLGLSLCKELVKLHGGTLWLNSIPGNGSTFFFTLPTAGPGAP